MATFVLVELELGPVTLAAAIIEAVLNQRLIRPTPGAPIMTFHQSSSQDWHESIGNIRSA